MMRAAAALLLLPLLTAAAPSPDYAAPYRILQLANLELDPTLAASAYATDATLAFDYPGQPPEAFRGRDMIRASYTRAFGQVDAGTPIRLHFRFDPPGLTSDRQSGVYRVDAAAGGRAIMVYGRFSVTLVQEKGAWRFAVDHGTPATAADFELLPPSNLEVR